MSSDLRDDLGVADPGLRLLLRSLAGAPMPDELAGEHAAIAMFRAAHSPLVRTTIGDAVDDLANRTSRTSRTVRRSRCAQARKNQVWRVAWLTAATTLALSGGFTAAGYAAALPPPVQHIAHSLLGFAGVPDSSLRGESGHPPGRAAPSASRRGSSRSGSPGYGRPTSSPAPSATAPQVSVRYKTAGHRATAVLTVTWPLAQRGYTVELQSLSASGWKTLGSHRIGHAGQTKFAVLVGTASVTYRIVLLSGNHVQSVLVTVSGRPRPSRHHRRWPIIMPATRAHGSFPSSAGLRALSGHARSTRQRRRSP